MTNKRVSNYLKSTRQTHMEYDKKDNESQAYSTQTLYTLYSRKWTRTNHNEVSSAVCIIKDRLWCAP